MLLMARLAVQPEMPGGPGRGWLPLRGCLAGSRAEAGHPPGLYPRS